MLNKDALSQLKGLKSQMEAEKEYAQATVKGTQSRYGFAQLDDGREIFIPPDEMQRVFPRDTVNVCVRPTKDNKTIANIESLVESPLSTFAGRCVRKGKAVFVQPDLPDISRWLFIPPHARNGVKEGDYIHCAIMRHPIKDGRPQAKVLSVLGAANTPGIENLYCQTKHQLPGAWPQDSEQRYAINDADNSEREDLTDLDFVTIDAAKTLDIDDALYAQTTSDGWVLRVAIADPTARIPLDSPLHENIASRGTSVYFHGDVIPMLPEFLSHEHCALSEGNDRPALVCTITVKDSGEVCDFRFSLATIRSRAKLSYFGVERYLAGDSDNLMANANPLEALYQVYRALSRFRGENELVMEDRQEYRWVMDDDKKLQSVESSEKLQSQKLVEECMIAANRCAARFLTEHQCNGPFIGHAGFRQDRHEEAQTFLQRLLPDLADTDITSLAGYRRILSAATDPSQALPLRSMLNRLMARAELTDSPAKHMGMGLEAYTNCTSPLRKYTDFLVHLQIKAILRGERSETVNPEVVEQLNRHNVRARSATLEAERWLANDYLQRNCAADTPMNAVVAYINSSGFNVRLLDSGLEGFVDLRKDPEKFSFDKWTASLTSTTRRFQLEQAVEVVFSGVDDTTRNAQFSLVEGCGLKPPKAPPADVA